MKDSHYLENLIATFKQNPNLNFLHFWGHTPKQLDKIDKSCLSQWFPAKFTIDGVEYATAEHYMMAQKAKLFNDEDSFQKIINSKDPSEAKKLGRGVKNYDGKTWEQHRFDIVLNGNIAKFSQNHVLKEFLLSTQDKILVEASPVDAIWGIGLAEQDAKVNDPTQWKGLNLLGFALMQVRQNIGT